MRSLPFFSSFLQGVTYLIYPAAAELLTQELSTYGYGALFLPMIAGTILTSLYGNKFKNLFTLGNLFNALSMTLFSSAALFFHPIILFLSLFFLGLGYGALTTALPPLMKCYKNIHRASLLLFSLFVLGAALTPPFYSLVSYHIVWWLAPLITALLFFVLALFLLPQEKGEELHPKTLWPFLATSFLFGLTCTLYSNWAIPYLRGEKGLTLEEASFALSLFWWMILIGRLLMIPFDRWIKQAFLITPLFVALSFLLFPFATGGLQNTLCMAFGGLSLSIIFPCCYSFAAKNSETKTSGQITTAFILGFGAAAFFPALFDIPFYTTFWIAALLSIVMAYSVTRIFFWTN